MRNSALDLPGMSFDVLARNVGDEFLKTISFRIQDKRRFHPLLAGTKPFCTEEYSKL